MVGNPFMPPREDIAVWVLVSSASVDEYQHDLQANEHNTQCAMEASSASKEENFYGKYFGSKEATAVDACGNYGFAGTYGGQLCTWELPSGKKLAGTQCFSRGRVSCVAVDSKSV
ncbi:hypothetical protein ACP70R_023494 [Stipagrostis hirtigluma subsp. patula]